MQEDDSFTTAKILESGNNTVSRRTPSQIEASVDQQPMHQFIVNEDAIKVSNFAKDQMMSAQSSAPNVGTDNSFSEVVTPLQAKSPMPEVNINTQQPSRFDSNHRQNEGFFSPIKSDPHSPKRNQVYSGMVSQATNHSRQISQDQLYDSNNLQCEAIKQKNLCIEQIRIIKQVRATKTSNQEKRNQKVTQQCSKQQQPNFKQYQHGQGFKGSKMSSNGADKQQYLRHQLPQFASQLREGSRNEEVRFSRNAPLSQQTPNRPSLISQAQPYRQKNSLLFVSDTTNGTQTSDNDQNNFIRQHDQIASSDQQTESRNVESRFTMSGYEHMTSPRKKIMSPFENCTSDAKPKQCPNLIFDRENCVLSSSMHDFEFKVRSSTVKNGGNRVFREHSPVMKVRQIQNNHLISQEANSQFASTAKGSFFENRNKGTSLKSTQESARSHLNPNDLKQMPNVVKSPKLIQNTQKEIQFLRSQLIDKELALRNEFNQLLKKPPSELYLDENPKWISYLHNENYLLTSTIEQLVGSVPDQSPLQDLLIDLVDRAKSSWTKSKKLMHNAITKINQLQTDLKSRQKTIDQLSAKDFTVERQKDLLKQMVEEQFASKASILRQVGQDQDLSLRCQQFLNEDLVVDGPTLETLASLAKAQSSGVESVLSEAMQALLDTLNDTKNNNLKGDGEISASRMKKINQHFAGEFLKMIKRKSQDMQRDSAMIALQRTKKKLLFTDIGCQAGQQDIDNTMMRLLDKKEMKLQMMQREMMMVREMHDELKEKHENSMVKVARLTADLRQKVEEWEQSKEETQYYIDETTELRKMETCAVRNYEKSLTTIKDYRTMITKFKEEQLELKRKESEAHEALGQQKDIHFQLCYKIQRLLKKLGVQGINPEDLDKLGLDYLLKKVKELLGLSSEEEEASDEDLDSNNEVNPFKKTKLQKKLQSKMSICDSQTPTPKPDDQTKQGDDHLDSPGKRNKKGNDATRKGVFSRNKMGGNDDSDSDSVSQGSMNSSEMRAFMKHRKGMEFDDEGRERNRKHTDTSELTYDKDGKGKHIKQINL